MKIGCLCISTPDRSPVIGIALASYMSQTVDAKLNVWDDCGNVTARLDEGCKYFFDVEAVDLVTVWDDDDFSPPNRLAATAYAFEHRDCPENTMAVGGYRDGFFVNLRTLRGEYYHCPPEHPVWGSTLTFTQDAWEAAGGFAGRTVPGQDRSFVQDALKAGAELVHVEAPLNIHKPHAFVHGKNIATTVIAPREHQLILAEQLRQAAPAAVWAEIQRARQFLVDRRVYPAGCTAEDIK
jgi:hypothetical protein